VTSPSRCRSDGSANPSVGCLLGRLNYQGRQLSINRKDNFTGLPCLVMTGSDDADHPKGNRSSDGRLAARTRHQDYHFLSDHGISGNGHMLMSEDNSSEVADHIANWLAAALPTGYSTPPDQQASH
jgi:alpha-beta hydrolase superfamily lysophospholipase